MLTFDYSGYNVIVTGGTRGIGKAITVAFLESGANVTALYASNDTTAIELKNAYPTDKLKTAKLDISNYEDVEKFFAEYDEANESLDVLVNNAGIRRDAIVGMMDPTDWHQVIQTNLTGTFNMSKFAVHKMMQNRFGRIINITSPSGKLGFEGQANYASSKAGQVAFTKSMAKEVARRKITVNCISPGFIGTELLSDLSDDLKKKYLGQIPLKRFGEPEEVADAALFLASKEAAYITGSVLEITGGI